ncbi:MAG: type II secretion system secretin GspD [Pseudomonadota bacterium]
MTRLMRLSTTSVLALSMLVGPVVAPTASLARQTAPAPVMDDVVINMRGADIKDVAEQVSRITGRTLVLDPNVQGVVNVVSAEPLSRNGVWELFLSVLRTSGFAAVRSGNVWRVVPQAAVVQGGASETGPAQSNQQIITRVVRFRNLPSDQAVRALRPLVSSFGAIEAITDPNAVVVTDYAENIRRVQQLAQSLDAGGGTAFDSFTLRYASAVDTAEAIGSLLGSDAGGPRVSADERSNSVLVRGDAADIAQAREIIRSLDTPGGATPVTRVVRLRNSDAESVAAIVAGLMGAEPSATNVVARSLRNDTGLASLSSASRDAASSAMGASGGTSSAATRPLAGAGANAAAARPAQGFTLQDVTVQPAPELNAIVMRGAPATVAMLEDLIVQLDLRRAQVKIEVAIVEITGELGEQIGVQLGFGGAVPADGVAGGSSFSNAGTAIGTVLTALGYPTGQLLSSGLSLAAGQRNEFGLLLQALGTTSSANLLSTPSITVLDNQPAEIVVGQNVPFRTGSFATDGNTLNPFTTISREDVGLTLRVIPRVHDGDVVKLDVSQEVSSLVTTNVTGAADLITNRRSIQTSVLADDGETIVLGGLVTDDRQSVNSGVPGLSSLPGVGGLFRSRRDSQTRRTLFIFLKPTILRDVDAVGADAQESYDRLRAAEPFRVDPAYRPPRVDPAAPRLQPDVDGVF